MSNEMVLEDECSLELQRMLGHNSRIVEVCEYCGHTNLEGDEDIMVVLLRGREKQVLRVLCDHCVHESKELLKVKVEIVEVLAQY